MSKVSKRSQSDWERRFVLAEGVPGSENGKKKKKKKQGLIKLINQITSERVES